MVAIALTSLVQPVSAQAPPPLPAVINGVVSLSGGGPIPDGTVLVGRINEYETPPVVIRGGEFENLVIAPQDGNLVGRSVSFHLVLKDSNGDIIDSVTAPENITYQPALITRDFSITFSRIPLPPATPTPMPTPTPTLTPTPTVAQPAIFSGLLIVVGGVIPDSAQLTARMGDYVSDPALIIGDEFKNLVVDPGNPGFIGQEVEFILDGVSSNTVVTFASGGSNRDLELIFRGLPTPTPTPTLTPTPTATLTPSPTPTPTATPSPTVTALPPTPAVEAQTPTATVEPTATPDPSGFFGTCSAPSGEVPVRAAVANGLLLLGPLGLIWAYRRRRSHGE